MHPELAPGDAETVAPAPFESDFADSPRPTGWRRLVPAWWRDRPAVPQELTAVALAFGIQGAITGGTMLNHLIHGRIHINFSVLGLLIGYGLLQLNARAHGLAKFVLWASFPFTAAVWLTVLFNGDSPNVTLGFDPSGPFGAVRGWVLALFGILCVVWQLRVLLQPEVNALFRAQSAVDAVDRERRATELREVRAAYAARLGQRRVSRVAVRRLSPALVCVSRSYASAPERVFSQWINPDALRLFMVGPESPGIRATVDATVGGSFRVAGWRGDSALDQHGVYMEIESPRRIRFRFSADLASPPAEIMIEVDPHADGCELTLTLERDVVSQESARDDVIRWTKVLDNLHRLLSLHPSGAPRISFPA